jgi:hypothetical protein
MGWTKLANSTTADANEVHANFVEIHSTHLLPMKLSTTAAQTDAAYDLGSSTKHWRKAYVSSITAVNVERVITQGSLATGTVTTAILSSGWSVSTWNSLRFRVFFQRAVGAAGGPWTFTSGFQINSLTATGQLRITSNGNSTITTSQSSFYVFNQVLVGTVTNIIHGFLEANILDPHRFLGSDFICCSFRGGLSETITETAWDISGFFQARPMTTAQFLRTLDFVMAPGNNDQPSRWVLSGFPATTTTL